MASVVRQSGVITILQERGPAKRGTSRQTVTRRSQESREAGDDRQVISSAGHTIFERQCETSTRISRSGKRSHELWQRTKLRLPRSVRSRKPSESWRKGTRRAPKAAVRDSLKPVRAGNVSWSGDSIPERAASPGVCPVRRGQATRGHAGGREPVLATPSGTGRKAPGWRWGRPVSAVDPREVLPRAIKLRNDYGIKVEAVLSDAQRKQWREMLGKSVDVFTD